MANSSDSSPRSSASFYRQLDHTGDCAIEVWGASRAELFGHCALAFYDLVVGLERIDQGLERRLEIDGDGDLELLFNLYDELVFRFDVDGFLAARVEIIECSARRVVLRAFGETWERDKHDYQVVIKAATYHLMTVEDDDGSWRARIVFDL